MEALYFPNRELWEICEMMFEEGNKNKKYENMSRKFYMTSLLMAFLSYEGYINCLGMYITPDVWKKERKFFSGKKYRGINGKLKFLLEEKMNVKMPNKKDPPYSTILTLKNFRDTLSHPKFEKAEIYADYDLSNELSYPVIESEKDMREFCTADNSKIIIEHVKDFVDWLHEKYKKYVDFNKIHNIDQFYYGPPLEGPTWTGSGGSTVVD